MLISQKTLLISSFSPKIVKSRIFQLQKKTGWNNDLMVVWLSFFFFDRGAGMKSTRVLGRHKEQWPPTTDRRQSHTASRGDSKKSCLFETFNIFFSYMQSYRGCEVSQEQVWETQNVPLGKNLGPPIISRKKSEPFFFLLFFREKFFETFFSEEFFLRPFFFLLFLENTVWKFSKKV